MKIFIPYLESILIWLIDTAPPAVLEVSSMLLVIVVVGALIVIGVTHDWLAKSRKRTIRDLKRRLTADNEVDVDTKRIIRDKRRKLIAVHLAGLAAAFYVINLLVAVFVVGDRLHAINQSEIDRLLVAVQQSQTEAELIDLMVDGRTPTISAIAQHALAKTETQRRIAEGDYSDNAKIALAERPLSLTNEAAHLLIVYGDDATRLAMAGRPDIAEDLLTALMHDQDVDVAVRAFENSRASTKARCGIVQAILEGSDDYEHFRALTGELVDYCSSVHAARRTQ